MPDELLFHKFDYFSVAHVAKQHLEVKTQNLTLTQIHAKDPESIVAELVDEFAFTTPVLKRSELTRSSNEVDIDTTYDPTSFTFPGHSPIVRGTRITIHVPFDGEAEIFRVRASRFNTNPPRAAIHQDELQLNFDVRNSRPVDIGGELDRRLASIEEHLTWLRENERQLRAELAALASREIASRKQQLDQMNSYMQGLGIPEKPNHRTVDIEAAATAVRMRGGKARRWDIFLSHASEDKAGFVDELAQRLRASGFEVWYDDFVLSVGNSLRRKIDEGLANSRYGAVLLSPSFFAKQWPVRELNGLATRPGEIILPVWLDVTHEDVAQFSPILADTVALKKSDGIDAVVAALIEKLRMET